MNTNSNANTNNCFSGPQAIGDFLDPAKRAPLPLVELADLVLNPFLEERVHIYGCLGYLSPLLHIKGDAVHNMLKMAKSRGELKGKHTIAENTSGNTGAALGVLGPLFGINHIKAILPWDRAPGKGEILRLLSVEEKLVKKDGIAQAQEMGKTEGCINLNQYANPDNPAVFATHLAPNIWKQRNGDVTILAAALGTTGTVIGCSNFFRSQKSERPGGEKVFIIGVNVAPGDAVPGARTLERLKEITLPWQSAIDARMETGWKESYEMSLRLMERGLFAGPSSGLALVGLHKLLKVWLTEKGDFSGLYNKGGDVVAVVIFPDTFWPYTEKYSVPMNPEDFGVGREWVAEGI
jgi:cysteine synthase B